MVSTTGGRKTKVLNNNSTSNDFFCCFFLFIVCTLIEYPLSETSEQGMDGTKIDKRTTSNIKEVKKILSLPC